MLVCGLFPSLLSTLGCCLAFVMVVCCALRMFWRCWLSADEFALVIVLAGCVLLLFVVVVEYCWLCFVCCFVEVWCFLVLCVVCCLLMSFVGCCVGLRFVPFVVVHFWLLFGIRYGCLLCVEDVWRCWLSADEFVLVMVLACCVLLLFVVV